MGSDRDVPRGSVKTVSTSTGVIATLLAFVVLLAGCTSSTGASPSTTEKASWTLPTVPVGTFKDPVPASTLQAQPVCEVEPSRGLTDAQLAAIQNHFKDASFPDGSVIGYGTCPGGPVMVDLTAGSENFARAALATYGDDLYVTIGGQHFTGAPRRSPKCGRLALGGRLPEGVRMSVTLKKAIVTSGASIEGLLRISESGPSTYHVISGDPIAAYVVRTNTLQVVGIDTEATTGTGYADLLGPGKWTALPFFGGTQRCDGGLGTALPPGNYQVVVPLYQTAPDLRPSTPMYLVGPVPLRITKAP
jgi:hypothetical protein